MSDHDMTTVRGTVVTGIGAAALTLKLQMPYFAKLFPEVKDCHLASINLEMEQGLRVFNPDFETPLIPVLQDRSFMPSPAELKFDPITADWTYIRWLGDRKSIEEQTTTWDRTVVDRTSELSSWVDFCYQMRKRGVIVFAYANNHYAGHAPATIKQFQELARAKGFPEIGKPLQARHESSLFD